MLGAPIAHSKSPLLHRTAYELLGLPWSYEAIRVGADELAEFIGSRGADWRGLSLTMPLKREVLPLLDQADDLVDLVGTANTVLFDSGRIRGFNTDVYGVIAALRAIGVLAPQRVRVLGAGATAASVLVAVNQLGAQTVVATTRSPQNAGPLIALAGRLNQDVAIEGLEFRGWDRPPDIVISTVPGGARLNLEFPEQLRRAAPLLDVSYDPWPSPLAIAWQSVGGRVSSGLEMLAHQALAQVRIFVGGDPETVLPGEAAVLAAMRKSVGLPPSAETV